MDEQFDEARFGVWLEVMVEAGVEVAAAKLAGMPLEQLIAGFARYTRVFDLGAVISFETTTGEIWDYSGPVQGRSGIELAGYHIVARREDRWDAIVDVLLALETHHPDRFHELMAAVRSHSHAKREEDGFYSLLEDRDQMMFDAASERERRRQQRGFLSPADARAFLQMSRSGRTNDIGSNPIARAYARSIEVPEPSEAAGPVTTAEEESAVVQLLADAGVAPLQSPRALLPGADAHAGQSKMQRLLQVVLDRDPVVYGERQFELAYLANVLIAGCSIQGRPFTPREAADGAVAICNLGLESLGDLPVDYLITSDLIGAFQNGCATLHQEVSLRAARELVDVLADLRVADEDLQIALNLLAVRLSRETNNGTPWNVAAGLDVITAIDMPAWAALTGLLAECPVIHGGLKASLDPRVRSVDPNAFEFISEPDQVALVRKFMASLPGILNA